MLSHCVFLQLFIFGSAGSLWMRGLIVASGGSSLVVVCGLLTVGVSLVAERGF